MLVLLSGNILIDFMGAQLSKISWRCNYFYCIEKLCRDALKIMNNKLKIKMHTGEQCKTISLNVRYPIKRKMILNYVKTFKPHVAVTRNIYNNNRLKDRYEMQLFCTRI